MTASRAAELADALAALRGRLEAAARTVGRDVGEIELLPVTKFFPATDVIELRRLGCNEFGESREKEASNKVAEVAAHFASEGSPPLIRWHMIGRVQRNKARAIAGWADTVHAVDGTALAAALDRAASAALDDGRRANPMKVYVQVSLDGDPARGGVDIGRAGLVDELCAAVAGAHGLEFVGLMGIPPLGSRPSEAFARLAAERERVQPAYQQRLGLSAGMSGDLEAAVEHGSTCVRVGTALLGQRPLTSP
jgi:pyridoxal phosphate enzyme (YggS family)